MAKDFLRRIARALLRPSPLIWGARLARNLVPVLNFRGSVYLFRHDDVRDALDRDQDFGVVRVYAQGMEATTGAFFLGMDDGPQYQRESAFARTAIHGGDVDRLVALVERHAGEILSAHALSGQIDLVSDYFRRIPLLLLRDFFGVPNPGDGHDPDGEAKLAHWMRIIFWELFLNLSGDEDVRERAIAAGQELKPHLRALVAAETARQAEGQPAQDTFLGRLVAARRENFSDLDDEAIVRNVGGVIVGSVDTVSKACALILEELGHRPEQLTLARAAAQSGDDASLRGILFEALRFNPHNPILVRHASKDTVVAKNTKRSRPVAAGTQVVPVLVGATFDPEGFPNPNEFDPQRPLKGSMNFGWGLHRCFGEHLVYATVPAMMRMLLRCELVEAERSRFSPYVSQGPFPDHYPARLQVGSWLAEASEQGVATENTEDPQGARPA